MDASEKGQDSAGRKAVGKLVTMSLSNHYPRGELMSRCQPAATSSASGPGLYMAVGGNLGSQAISALLARLLPYLIPCMKSCCGDYCQSQDNGGKFQSLL